MKRGSRPLRLSGPLRCATGYTIVEAMVVLAVTALMFSMVVGLMQGQQARTQFNQAIRDFESVLRDVIDDTATGFFPGNANFTCTIVTGAPLNSAVRITAPDRSQGTNTGCIFVGKVMQFGVRDAAGCTSSADNDNCTRMNVFSLAGRARIDKAEVTDLRQADPTVVNDLTVPLYTRYGLRVTKVYSNVPGQPTDEFGSIAFLTTLGKYNGTTDLLSGAQTINALVVPQTAIGQTTTGGGSASARINDQLDDLDDSASRLLTNPSGGIVICLQGGNDQRAAVVIGANNRKLTTETLVEGGVDERYPGVCPS